MHKINLPSDALSKLNQLFIDNTFSYQREWSKQENRTRHLTKTRQCGADWLFTLEALMDAVRTGRDQIFLSDDEGLLDISHHYFLSFLQLGCLEVLAEQSFNGSRVVYRLSNGAQISFLIADALMAAYSGNVYVPEYAWTHDPVRLMKLASGLACHKQHRQTFYTTPSPSDAAWHVYQKITAPKCDAWNGVITIEDLLNSDCTLFTKEHVESLRRSFTADHFAMAYMCQWPQAVA